MRTTYSPLLSFDLKRRQSFYLSKFLVLFFILVRTLPSLGQVTIQERIEIIEPLNEVTKLNRSGDIHLVRAELFWDDPRYEACIVIVSPTNIGTNGYWAPGGYNWAYIENGPYGNYWFQARFHRDHIIWWGNLWVTYKIYFNNFLVSTGQSQTYPISSYINGFDFSKNLVEDTKFIAVTTDPDTIYLSNESDIIVQEGKADSTFQNFPAGQEFEVEIIRGAQYGTIVSPNGVDTSDHFTNITEGFKFRAVEDIDIDFTEVTIRVLTNVQGTGNIYGYGEVMVRKDFGLDHFDISIISDYNSVEDTLAFAETATLYITAKDSNDWDYDLSPDTLLTLAIAENEQYLAFIDAEGDTVYETDYIILDGVRYEDAYNGEYKIAAVKQNPETIDSCLIYTELENDATKYGARYATVLEQSLKIIMDTPYVVQPIITGRRNDENHNTYLANTNDNNMKVFQVELTRGGDRINNHQFELSTDYIDGSGGHDHTPPNYARRLQTTDRQKRQNYGRFYSFQDQAVNNPITETTIADSALKFHYIASLWGDEMKLFLNSQSNSLFCDTVLITERISNLVELLPGDNYELVGAPNNHSGTNDPCRTNPPTSQHYENHFGIQTLIDLIPIIAERFSEFYPGYRFRINDMSVLNGGKFEFHNNWTGPHCEHRMGTNVDIGYTTIDPNNDCEWNYTTYHSTLEDIINLVTDCQPVPEGDHFHAYINVEEE